MININSYTEAGTKTTMAFPKELEEKINMDLLTQAVRVYQNRSHPGLSKVKTRSEVALTTAKVWRQKGTGRARHGARSAPIFVGGGVAHGPKGVKRTLKISRKMANKSLLIALSLKAKKGHIVVVKDLSKAKKTKEAQGIIKKIIAKEDLKVGVNVSLVITKENVQARRSFGNIGNVKVLNCENLGTLDVFLGGLLIFEKEAFDTFTKIRTSVNKRVGKKKVITKNTEITEGTGKPKKVITKDAGKTKNAENKKSKATRARSKIGTK